MIIDSVPLNGVGRALKLGAEAFGLAVARRHYPGCSAPRKAAGFDFAYLVGTITGAVEAKCVGAQRAVRFTGLQTAALLGRTIRLPEEIRVHVTIYDAPIARQLVRCGRPVAQALAAAVRAVVDLPLDRLRVSALRVEDDGSEARITARDLYTVATAGTHTRHILWNQCLRVNGARIVLACVPLIVVPPAPRCFSVETYRGRRVTHRVPAGAPF